MRGIALCGYMGCGKSTVAKILKDKTAREYIDTDKYIEEHENMPISEIFSKYGENYFRDREHEAIKELSNKDDLILSLGGGAVMYKRNVELLRQNGYLIFFLNPDIKVIKERLKNDSKRPLLQTNDIEQLYNKRLPTYKAVCDYEVYTDKNDSTCLADKISDILNSI